MAEMLRRELDYDLAQVNFITAAFRFYRGLIDGGLCGETDASKETERMLRDSCADVQRIFPSVGENKICSVFDYMVLQTGNPVFDTLSGFVSLRKEVRLPCGSIDRLVEMPDNVFVVVEIKGPGSRRDHACGLGQVLLYSSAVRSTMQCKDTKMMLVVGGDYDKWIEDACKSVGVEYVSISREAVDCLDKISYAWRGIR